MVVGIVTLKKIALFEKKMYLKKIKEEALEVVFFLFKIGKKVTSYLWPSIRAFSSQ